MIHTALVYSGPFVCLSSQNFPPIPFVSDIILDSRVTILRQITYICQGKITTWMQQPFHTQCSILSLPSGFLAFPPCESGAGLRLSGLRPSGLRLTGLRRPRAGDRRGNLISFSKIGLWILFGWEIAFRSCSLAAFAL